MNPNNPFQMLSSAASAPPSVAASAPPSVAASPYDYSTNTIMTTQHQQNVDYFMSYASPNLLTIQETISMDLIAEMGQDAIKKHVKHNMTSKLAEEIASKVTFTSQENYAEHTKIIRAKTYVFTADELKAFVEKCIK